MIQSESDLSFRLGRPLSLSSLKHFVVSALSPSDTWRNLGNLFMFTTWMKKCIGLSKKWMLYFFLNKRLLSIYARKAPEHNPVYSHIRSSRSIYTVLCLYTEVICPYMVKYGNIFRHFLRCGILYSSFKTRKKRKSPKFGLS